jgi:hypothetical protein
VSGRSSMSTRSTSTWSESAVRSDWLVAPDFHPEFGLLCPSPRRRRRLRLAMTLILAGMGIGATIELAVAHWRDSATRTMIAGPIDEEQLREADAVPEPSGILVASMRPWGSAALTEAWPLPQHGSCKDAASGDLAASFLKSDCRPGKVHARHAERTPYRVATVIGGGTELPPAPAVAEAMPYSAAKGKR